MAYIDPHVPDHQIVGRSKSQIERDKAKADDLARQILFSGGSTYNGSPQALVRLAARAGKPLPQATPEPGVKPGMAEE